MKSLIVEIKQKHIDKGLPKCYKSCPVALALKDMGFSNIWCSLNEISSNSFSFKVSGLNHTFMYSFDNGCDVDLVN